MGPVAISLSGPAADFTRNDSPRIADRVHHTAAEIRDAFANGSDYLSAADPVTQARNVKPMQADGGGRRRALRASGQA